MKGVKNLLYTVGLMFLAPVVLYQAFKNEDHPLFIPVLVLGSILAVAAIGMGFYSIKILIQALFDDSK